jgi:hypothetical protein
MKLMTLIFCLLLSLNVFSNQNDPYFQVKEHSIVEVQTPVDIEYQLDSLEGGGLGPVIEIIDQLIALGKKLWPIIKAGKPVIKTDMSQNFSVLPYAKDEDIDFTQMEYWSIPKTQSYRVVYKNGYGMEVVAFTYTVQFQYGGQYNGIGHYLMGSRVIASNVKVAWGYEFNAKSEMANFSNIGSKKDPVAGATVDIGYSVKNIINEINEKKSFFITGEGQISQLN